MTELVFILDRSGSMSGLEKDTIGGFSSMIEKQKKEAGEALVSTVPNSFPSSTKCTVLLMAPTDAMGYALLFHWLLLPIAAFVISLRIGELVRRDGRMWLLPLALGLLYMLADFLTFRLANMLAFDKINLPQWDLFFIGAAISALGLLIGRLLGRRRSKPA